jgi:hypothetical protein
VLLRKDEDAALTAAPAPAQTPPAEEPPLGRSQPTLWSR